MKVFISWSGNRSNKIAECLKEWLAMVLRTDAFVSSCDIKTGELWRTKISNELSTTDYGIICLTKDNVLSPWILFEAGALSKNRTSRVIPLCFGFSPSEIPHNNPLSSFQGAEYSKIKIKNIVESLNSTLENKQESKPLERLFELVFPSLDSEISNYIAIPFENTEETANSISTCVDSLSEFQKSNAPEIIKSLLSWGYDISKIIRTNQTYDFIMEDTKLKKDGSPAVKITGTHIYTVVNKSHTEPLNLSFDMKDELGLQSTELGWGFESLFYTIENEERQEYPLQLADAGDGAKKNLRLSFDIPPEKSIKFEYVSVGIFLPNDRYIWYSQEFCENCKISVVNNTTIADFHRFQINHRDEDSLKHKIISKGKNHKIIDIDKNIYPREGFTMYWRER
jgi:hypothetical protein